MEGKWRKPRRVPKTVGGFSSHAPAASGDATEVVHCGTRNAKCVTPPSKETVKPCVFCTQMAARLLLSSSCLTRVSTLRETRGVCHATDNEQEIAQPSGCCQEYELGFDGRPHAEEHCELPNCRGVLRMHKQRCIAAAFMRIGGFSMEDPTLRNAANCPPIEEWKQHNKILPKDTKPFPHRACTHYMTLQISH